jgi:hypothetical protein
MKFLAIVLTAIVGVSIKLFGLMTINLITFKIVSILIVANIVLLISNACHDYKNQDL